MTNENNKQGKPSRKLWLGLTLGLLAISLGTLFFRNDLGEFCTTRAFGFPLPWYYEWCLCERDEPPVSLVNCAVNIGLCAMAGFALAKVVDGLKKRKAYDPAAA